MSGRINISAAVLLGILCTGCGSSARSGTSAGSAASAPTTDSSTTTDPDSEWSVMSLVDKMTNAQQWYAVSPTVSSMDPMRFPEADTNAWLAIACDKDSEWTYIGFSTSPNLNDTSTHDGYDTIDTRIKWDDHIRPVELIQKWGSRFLHFGGDDKAMINRIIHHKSALLELSWYEQGDVYFKFSLVGAEQATDSIRAKCGLKH